MDLPEISPESYAAGTAPLRLLSGAPSSAGFGAFHRRIASYLEAPRERFGPFRPLAAPVVISRAISGAEGAFAKLARAAALIRATLAVYAAEALSKVSLTVCWMARF